MTTDDPTTDDNTESCSYMIAAGHAFIDAVLERVPPATAQHIADSVAEGATIRLEIDGGRNGFRHIRALLVNDAHIAELAKVSLEERVSFHAPFSEN